MSIKREIVSSITFNCDACGKSMATQGNRPEKWAKLKLMISKSEQRTQDVCNECCYKIHQATGLNLLPE